MPKYPIAEHVALWPSQLYFDIFQLHTTRQKRCFFLYFKCCNAETYKTIAQNKRFVNIVELYHDIDLNWKRKNNDDIISSVSLTAYCSSPFTSS